MGYPCGREWVVIGRRAKKGLWDAGNILLVDLDVGYIGMLYL